jgi:hypothetical protein
MRRRMGRAIFTDFVEKRGFIGYIIPKEESIIVCNKQSIYYPHPARLTVRN